MLYIIDQSFQKYSSSCGRKMGKGPSWLYTHQIKGLLNSIILCTYLAIRRGRSNLCNCKFEHVIIFTLTTRLLCEKKGNLRSSLTSTLLSVPHRECICYVQLLMLVSLNLIYGLLQNLIPGHSLIAVPMYIVLS